MNAAHPNPGFIALAGNPNTGKTTVFNALTGLKQKTGNYPGVTVEKKSGLCRFENSKKMVQILDLPGAYGLLPRSPDEEVVRDVLYSWQKGVATPDFLILILDANNLQRNLYFALQVLEIGIPCLLALNMWDQAEAKGLVIHTAVLEKELGVRCVKTVGNSRRGTNALKKSLEEEYEKKSAFKPGQALHARMETAVACEVLALASEMEKDPECLCPPAQRQAEALRFISDPQLRNAHPAPPKPAFVETVQKSRQRLEEKGIDWIAAEAESRYAYIEALCRKAVTLSPERERTLSDYLDQVLTHPVYGLLIFFAFLFIIFQSIFSWAALPMDLIAGAVTQLGGFSKSHLPAGQLESLVTDGILPGVGNVVIFLPQIFFLFFFIAFFEDFGYMARATFVLDRLMKKAGLNGKAFLPLLSSFACAIPGIMSTKTIENRNDRLATILVAPLMSCSARLPVYALMIGAFIPSVNLFGFLNAKGLALFSMYILSIGAGLAMAGLFRTTLLRGDKTPFLFELPPYRLPNIRTVILAAWENARDFLARAGSIIFLLSIVLWFLLSHPQNMDTKKQFESMRQAVASQNLAPEVRAAAIEKINRQESGEIVRSSYGGHLGRFIEPVIQPLGFDWKIGIGLVGSFAAREVLISTLAIVYNVGPDADEKSVDLITALQNEKNESGRPVYTPLVAISLMVFFVLACQCLSTIAIVRRETLGWKWPLFMVFYMTVLAWVGSFAVFQIGKIFGFA